MVAGEGPCVTWRRTAWSRARNGLLVLHLAVPGIAVDGRRRVQLPDGDLDVECAAAAELRQAAGRVDPEVPARAVLTAELGGRHQERARVDLAAEGQPHHVTEDRLVAQVALVQVVEHRLQLGAVLAPRRGRDQDRGFGHDLGGRGLRVVEDRRVAPLPDDARLRDRRRSVELLARPCELAGHARQAAAAATAVGEAVVGWGEGFGRVRVARGLQQLHSVCAERLEPTWIEPEECDTFWRLRQ